MKVNGVCRLIFVLILFRISDAEYFLKDENYCVELARCPANEICSVYCKDDCIKKEHYIWGTVSYASFSPVCRSAVHDFRISLWNISERSVSFKEVQPRSIFLGSSRMGISSNMQDYTHGEGSGPMIRSYEFLSPYISENIFNIASLHVNYLFGENEEHRQYCFINKNKTNINFSLYVKINNDKPSTIITSREGVSLFVARWRGTIGGGGKLNAGYQCYPESNTLSTLTSLAFRKDAHFYPVRLTITVNVNEKVNLQMIENEVCKGNTTIWRKDGEIVTSATSHNASQLSITFPAIEVGHSGIYSLECANSNISRAGFVQVIVRACPKEKYGNLCSKNCSGCLNGGICHDFNGRCICPPGFDGSTCEKTCAPGTFGRKCKMKCNDSSSDILACKGVLICLPHPYGCSCAAGFTGIFCNETCEPGSFGAGCIEKRHCHCANGENCNVYTGYCDGECDTNWYGKQCDYTLTDVVGLSILSVSSCAVNLTWKSPSELYVATHARYYIITYQRIGWRYVRNASGDEKIFQKNTTDTNFVLDDLKPSAIYRVHVHANIASKYSTFNYTKSEVVVETSFTTPPPPTDFHIWLHMSSTLFLAWSSAFPPGGLLHYYHIIYKDMKTNYTDIDILHNTFDECRDQSFEYCHTITDLLPNHEYEIELIAFNKNVSTGSEAVSIMAKTTPSDPITTFKILVLWHGKSEAIIKIIPGNADSSVYSAFLIVVDTVDENDYLSKVNLSDGIHNKSRCIVSASHEDIYIAAKIHSLPKNGTKFTVGNKSCVNGFFNRPLKSGTMYRIGVAAIISFCQKDIYSEVVYAHKTVFIESFEAPTGSASLSVVLGFLLPLLIIVGILLVLLYFWKWKRYVPMMKRRFISKKGSSESVFGTCNEALDEMEIIETESLCEDLSNCIPVEELRDFTKHGVKNNTLKKEFLSLPKGQLYPCSVAKLPDNKYKNRYGNILPYDHSRVKLDIADGSNYIHGNYIDGYKQPQKYIATQGPMYNTVTDFWSMIWNEKVSKIIMIANVMENGRCKCEKYWPDACYGDIKISLEKEESFADFVVRTFNVTKDGKSREIKHFHFVSWPDHDVPLNTTPFISFLKRVRTCNVNCSAPVVIHCSAGIGRTGTVILFENAFQMGTQENQVDVLGLLCSMRKQRMNIVENYDQYVFVYHALVEALCTDTTSIKSKKFLKEYSKLINPNEETGVSVIESQFQMLNEFRRLMMPKDIHSAYMVVNQSKNRSMYILPSDRARPLLGRDSNDSDYINAVFIDSYVKKDSYIATQYPLRETVLDFWRMVFTLKSKIIVLLQDIPFSDLENLRFWPEQGSVQFGKFLVKSESVTEEIGIIVSNLCVNDIESEEQNSPLSVKLVQIKSWPVGCELPSDTSAILAVEKFLNTCEKEFVNNVITITCLDGVTACGIFCAFLHIIERMKFEQEIDIFQSVKCTRTNRAQFIINLEHYTFLFELIKAFLEITP